MTTIFDVADLAGVSKSTVAGILNDAPRFNKDTRRRVLDAARQLGYRPNYLSKALAGAKSMTIGLVLGSYDPLIISSVQAIEGLAREARYRPFIVFAPRSEDPLVADTVRDLLDRRVDGILAYSYDAFLPPVQRVLDLATMPVVYMRTTPPRAPHVVRMERDVAVRQLAAHLRGLGHRRVVELRWPGSPGRPMPLHATYDRAFAAEGVELVSGRRWDIRLEEEDHGLPSAAVYRMIRQALAQGERPTAITVADDELAMAVIAALRDAGLRVPEDVSVAGKDGHPAGEVCRPALTTIHEPQVEAGAAAFGLLLALMRDPAAEVAAPHFEARLVIRRSTGPVAR